MNWTLALERRLLARNAEPPSTLALVDYDTGRLVLAPPSPWLPPGLIPRIALRAMLLAAVLSPRALTPAPAFHNAGHVGHARPPRRTCA